MKPETKFRRAVVKLAKSFGIEAACEDYMGGLDCRTRKAWKTFILKSDKAELPQGFAPALEQLNNETFEGIHAMTGLPCRIEMAVRVMKLDGRYFNFKDATLIPRS